MREPGAKLLPGPVVHPNLTPLAALPGADEDCPARGVEVTFGEAQRLADPQSGAPKDDDQAPGARAVDATSGRAHYRDDLLHTRRVSGIPNSLVAGRAAGKIPGHGRGRAWTAGGIEHPMRGHVRLLWSGFRASLQPRTHAEGRVLGEVALLSKALAEAPPEIQRQVFEAFDLQITYDKAEGRVEISATVSEAIAEAFENVKALQMEGSQVVARDIAGAGFEPATFGL